MLVSPAMKAHTVSFDFNNMMEDALGRGKGLRLADLQALRMRTRAIHAGIQQMRRNGTTPFYDIVFSENGVRPILDMAQRVRERFENLVVLGIGGSALGARALHQALNPLHHNSLPRDKRSGTRLYVADNIDPVTFGGLLDQLDLSQTLFNVISRSGETAETLAQFLIVRERLERAVGPRYKENLLVTTDAERGPLREITRGEGFLSLALPPGIVGRYSVFSAVGLLPAAAAGIDVRALLAGAREMAARCDTADLWKNPAYMNGALHYLAERKKRKGICVMMPYGDSLAGVAEWFCQLWAESLGKERDIKGKPVVAAQCPVRALGATDQHSQLQLYMDGPDDKVIDFIRVARPARALAIPRLYADKSDLGYLGGRDLGELLLAEQTATAMALAKKGRMNTTLALDNVTPHTIGQLLFMFELQTVLAAGLYGVNPFDQPAVEGGKKLAYGMMGRGGFEKERRELKSRQGKKDKRFIV
jgi:glucose-6-phosphate isomerase